MLTSNGGFCSTTVQHIFALQELTDENLNKLLLTPIIYSG